MTEQVKLIDKKSGILKWIEPRNFGPFCGRQRLLLDPRVTVLTGPNDTGKSALLRAITLLLTGSPIEEQDVNQERLGSFPGKWQEDGEIGCEACFLVSKQGLYKSEIAGDVKDGDEITTYTRFTAGSQNYATRQLKRGDKILGSAFSIQGPPKVLVLPTEYHVRELINLNKLNGAEDKLLKLGFGPEFTVAQYAGLHISRRSIALSKAQHILNERLKEILPLSMKLEFRLHEGPDSTQISIAMVDPIQNHVPLGSRGSGIGIIMNIMGVLLAMTKPKHPTLVLFDEPETSLHADAQHMLRRLLERLAESPLIQVVYATHSPSMINTMRPASIRVLERKLINDEPTSIINNEAFKENFLTVRSSLGITPADSLLYAPVTVIVEGPTEVRALPLMLNKLCAGGISGFEDADDVLSQIHFLDGQGDSYEYMCRLAKSQNAKPIVFLDGDKPAAVAKLQELHPEVPLILLDPGTEFENLIPQNYYIASVAATLQNDQITVDSYNNWSTAHPPKQTWMLSKRIGRWLDDEFDERLYKTAVMERAVKETPVSEIAPAPLRLLLAKMRELVGQV